VLSGGLAKSGGRTGDESGLGHEELSKFGKLTHTSIGTADR